MKTYDALVIGSGINGLVAAAILAGRGWSVGLIEANDRLGGFIDSGERTVPGYTHDTFSSWHPLFQIGGGYAALGADLARHGLEYANSDGAITASIGSDGRAVIAHRDPAATTADFEQPADREAYAQMLAEFDRLGDVIGTVLSSELSLPLLAKQAWKTWRRQARVGTELLARDLVSSGNAYLERRFAGWEVDRLWAPWLLHSGLGPEHATGGLMIPVFAATLHGVGMPVVRGGAANFIAAFEALLRERGVGIHLGSAVDSITVRDGVATGVTAGGEPYAATRAVLAGVTPTALYGALLPKESVPADVATQAAQYRYGRGAMQIHLALSAPLDWNDARLAAVPLVHLTDGGRAIAVSAAQAAAGMLPATPTVVVGQQSVLDPSRAPEGAATLWIQLQEVPYAPTSDAAGELDVSAGWSPALVDGYVDRVIGLIERHAPGIRASIVGMEVLSPLDLERANANAPFGDPYAGAGELDQNLLWRPLPALARHQTPVRNLWHIGASTHPGPGLGGGSGYLVSDHLGRARR